MPEKILFVDDEPKVTQSLRRQLFGKFEMLTADSGAHGLEVLDNNDDVAVVVSDFKMPGMNGVEFLKAVKTRHPMTVRMMLTGFADMDATMAAVNEGYIFRFLTKPCEVPVLINALEAGLEQYRLIQSERVLLRDTVRGSITMLSDIIALLKPEIHDRISRIRSKVKMLSRELGDPKPWETETAANLCLLGYISLPDPIINKLTKARALSQEEMEVYQQHLEVASLLVLNIPRMEGISKIIKYQEKLFDGTGIPHDKISFNNIPLGSRILKALLDYDALLLNKMRPLDAVKGMRMRKGWYDPSVLDALETIIEVEGDQKVRVVQVKQLEKGMILVSDLYAYVGGKPIKALGRGFEITSGTLEHLAKLAGRVSLSDTVQIIDPKPAKKAAVAKAKEA